MKISELKQVLKDLPADMDNKNVRVHCYVYDDIVDVVKAEVRDDELIIIEAE